MNELGIVIILLVCGAAIAAAAVIVAKLATRNTEKLAKEQEEEAANVAEAELEAAFESVQYSYRTTGRVMSAQQQDFYLKLAEIFGERCYVFPNVALAALVNTEIDGQDARRALEKIAGQAVDFVMCRADDLRVLCVVLLEGDQRAEILQNAGAPVAVMDGVEQLEKQQIVERIATAMRQQD